MKRSTIKRELIELLDESLSNKRSVSVDWLVQTAVQRHMRIEGPDRDLSCYCMHRTFRDVLREGLRERHMKMTKAARSKQMSLPFPMLSRTQVEYDIIENGVQVIIPLNRMTNEQCKAKAEELRGSGAGYFEHADQLDLYVELREKGQLPEMEPVSDFADVATDDGRQTTLPFN